MSVNTDLIYMFILILRYWKYTIEQNVRENEKQRYVATFENLIIKTEIL